MKILLTVALLSSVLNYATAEDVYSDQFQTIKSYELTEITKEEDGSEKETILFTKKAPEFAEQFNKRESTVNTNVAGVIMVTKELLALGKEIYEIVEAGKPVVEMNSEPIRILPRTDAGSEIEPMDLQGWRNPIVKKYRYTAKNYLNIEPVVIEFMLIFNYGGSLNGAGKYIAGAQIKPTYVDVKWGYELNATYKVQSIMNQGSAKNPVAAAVLMFDFNHKTVLQERTVNTSFFINGKGESKSL